MTELGIRIDEGDLVASTDRLVARFDATTGALVSLMNLDTGHQLIRNSDLPPWRLLAQGSMPSAYPAVGTDMGFQYVETSPLDCSFDVHDRSKATIRWITDSPGVGVSVRVEISDRGAVELWPEVHVGENVAPPAHFEFPLFVPNHLGSDDLLLFPAHSGWLIRQPLESASQGVYPDGYHGLSVQVMAYFVAGEGGFYIATHDPHVTHKEFTFTGSTAGIRHDTWDLRQGCDIDFDYPVVLAPLSVGDWFEAADLYRQWALQAPWSSRGFNRDRVDVDRPRWLFEEVGLSIWGSPSSLDWSDRYRHLGELMGGPLHIVSGWDWPATKPHFVGEEGWFPARFHEANLEAWADHYVTPYMNDLFISVHAPDFHERWEPNLIFPFKTFAFTVFSERSPDFVRGIGSGGDPRVTTDIDFYVCPVTTAQRDLHVWRDVHLVEDYSLAGIFYDISSGNPGMARCLRAEHGHSPGWSREVLTAYAENNAASARAIEAATGATPAQGVETIVEHVIGDIDFYVSRSAAGPVGGLEAFTLGPESPPGGERELVPLFQAVYHDVGPVHEDGWLTFEHTFGDIFYWITARLTVSWGGILSLHYANNPPELFEGMESGEIISWDGGHHIFEDLEPPDPGFIAFAMEMAELRLGIGNPYLAYGRMVAPIELDVPTVDLHFHRENAVLTGIVRDGVWTVPSVVVGVWEASDSRIGLFLVNVSSEEVQVDEELIPSWPIRATREVRVRGASGTASMSDGQLALHLTINPRQPALVELFPG